MKKNLQKLNRQRRVRSRIEGTAQRPRLSVFRSNTTFYAQLIDDVSGKSLLGVTEKHLERETVVKARKERARALGVLLAKKAIEKKIKQVVFDRGGYAYKGRVQSFAEGAREGGLQF